MAEFKISRLRYTWEGTWATDSFYNRDAVVEYDGKAYVCLVPHTSGEFYEDIAQVTEIGGANPYWTLMVDGKKWVGEWEPATFYSLGNLVVYGGSVYSCTTQHTSGQVLDTANWEIYIVGSKFNNAWTTSTKYGIGDVVKYGGIVYVCNETHVSAATNMLGLENSQSKWTVIYEGTDYKGEWQPNTRYKLNDLVKVSGSVWKAIQGHLSTSTYNDSTWEVWIPGQDYALVWSESVAYQVGDIVMYGGYSYINKTSDNLNNKPSVDAADWDLLIIGYNMTGEWSPIVNYRIGDTVSRGGFVFSASSDSSNEDPLVSAINTTYSETGSTSTVLLVASTENLKPGMLIIGTGFSQRQEVVEVVDETHVKISGAADGAIVDGETLSFVGINYQYWALVTPGTTWKYLWENNTDYVIGDLTVWQNATYFCVTNHTSTSLNRPDLDVDNENWQVFTYHARKNAMNTVADVETYHNGAYTAVPIGSQAQVLRSTDRVPAWKKLHVVQNVYYVTATGEDRVDFGDTWDTPWQTIKYACDFISNGIKNPFAKSVLVDNKAFLVAEMYEWMLYQKENTISPFSPSSVFDEAATIRDAEFIIDAVVYDMTRDGNSQTTAAALAYFSLENTSSFVNQETADAMPFIIAALTYLKSIMQAVVRNNPVTTSYQELNQVASPIEQVFAVDDMPEPDSDLVVGDLLDITLTALTEENADTIPAQNTGISATIFIKTGTYSEDLPIVVPENVALVGDELRGVVVQPLNPFVGFTDGTDATSNRILLNTYQGLEIGTPLQFTNTGPSPIENIVPGQTYYVLTVDEVFGITISETLNGPVFDVGATTYDMNVYGGGSLKDMFRMRNSTGLRNMSLTGLKGTLTEPNEFLTRRPTGPSYVSLDPGTGPNDTTTWITRRSPYVQNVTTFGYGCVGLKIDGRLHNGGNRSIVANDFTQIISDGIGVWVTGPKSLSELVSVFAYYGYAGYLAEDGARIRATNGNTSYGRYGVIAEGYDDTETPISGKVYNRSTQVQASVQSSFGSNATLLALQFANSGSDYTQTTTNLLKNSNNGLGSWSTDGNIMMQKNIVAPTGLTEAWTLTGTTFNNGSDFIYQDITIQPAGEFYENVSGSNITGSGVGATFDITVSGGEYLVSVNNPGSGYAVTNQILIQGKTLGGLNNTNDCILTVSSLTGSAIQSVTVTGTVPDGSDLSYTLSAYAKQGSASSINLYGIFSGTETVTSGIEFNFETQEMVAYANGDYDPVDFGAIELPDGWWRLWFAVNDSNGLNDTLTFKINPRGELGAPNYTYFYGSQAEISPADLTPSFYLETEDTTHTAYANYSVVGAGTGAKLIGDEIRSKSAFQARITDNGSGAGGMDYLTASNSAQGGSNFEILLAQSDINLNSNLNRMRVFINSGTGAGQYGYISYYNTISKSAQVLKESFDTLQVTSSSATTDKFSLGGGNSTESIYVGQPIQFIPTYYTADITRVAYGQIEVTATLGGTINTLTIASTADLRPYMPITFTGTTFGGVTTDYTYFVNTIESDTTFTIATQQFGSVWNLLTGTNAVNTMYVNFPTNTSYISGLTSNMAVNMPIQFTGTAITGVTVGELYYINDIISGSSFTISDTLLETSVTASDALTDVFTVDSTSGMVAFNPIVFTGTVFGNVVEDTKYYISSVIDETSITVVANLIKTVASESEVDSNLITVASTAGFIVDKPVMFVGTSFGDIETERTYYILAVNDSTTFTISATPGGSAVQLTSDVGNLVVQTFPADFALTSTSGTMTATTTGLKQTISSGTCLMVGTFSTSIFGNVETGVTYFIKTIDSVNNTFTVSEELGGLTLQLATKTGSMNIGAVGWDHINIGTPIEAVLDSSSVYYVEPRTVYDAPAFSYNAFTSVTLAPGTYWKSIAYGNNKWVAIPSGNATAAMSDDGETWTAFTLPSTLAWQDIAYGNSYWVIVTSGGSGASKVLYSKFGTQGWRTANLPSVDTWKYVVYGSGKFVAASDTGNTAFSTDFGKTWVAGDATGFNLSSIAYGNDLFVAVETGSDNVVYSTDGDTWTTATLPSSADWSSIAYGDGRFVVVASTSNKTAYSFDAETWYESNQPIAADSIEYGQGVFVALKASSSTAYISEGGVDWKHETVTNATYNACRFGYTSEEKNGVFVTMSGTNSVINMSAGRRAKGRAVITSGVITSISQWEPGSGYDTAPTVTFIDPNVTRLATVETRLGNGALGNPTFNNRGTGYSTASTQVTITGSGYADAYQTGLTIILKDLTALPQPGDNLTIAGVDQIFKVTSASAVFGTTAPNIEANVQIAPDMTVALSPPEGAAVTIRTKYSQCRLTGHDFLNVGYGNQTESNYPGLPADTVLAPQDQAVEVNYGRVFYTSTDQDGNFRVGGLFAVEQATGIVTLSASQFGLTGLETLSLGGIAVGGAGVVIRQFSTEDSFVANSNNIVPTQRSIKAYLASRLSQGGSNTFTGQLIAGTVLLGGPDKISSTIPEGTRGSNVKMADKVNVAGAGAAWGGDGAALAFFVKSWNHR